MKIVIKVVVLLLSICVPLCGALEHNFDTNKKNTFIKLIEDNPELVMRAALIGLTLEILIFSSSDDEYERLVKQLQPDGLLKQCLFNMSKACLVTIAHELGHAVAAKVLVDSPIAINIGANSFDAAKQPLVSNYGFSIVGLNPLVGYAVFKTVNNQKHRALIKAAGPLFGLFVNYWLKVLRAYYFSEDKKNSLYAALQPDFVDFQQLMNLIVPLEKSDAWDIYKACGFNEQQLKDLPANSMLIALYSAWISLEYTKLHAIESPSTRALTTLLNILVRNYIRIEA